MSPSTLSRRAVLELGLALALPVSARAAQAPDVRFLDAQEAAEALAGDADAGYFERMNLREIRARMQTPLEGMTTAEARTALRRFEAAQAQAFDEEEQRAVQDLVARLQPRLAERAPRLARTPWSFAKLGSAAEGGMPHTRGAHVVLPAGFVAAIVRGASNPERQRLHANILVHEQVHVLQRADPARFEPLFTDVFGFLHVPEAPMTPWLAQHLVQNPDAPDLGWLFPLSRVGGTGWILPAITLPDDPSPGRLQDFSSVGLSVERHGQGWRLVERPDGEPHRRPLSKIPRYEGFFPYADEAIHPNEIAAVALSHWALEDDPKLAKRPRIALLEAWARTALA